MRQAVFTKFLKEIPASIELGGNHIDIIIDVDMEYEKAGSWMPDENKIRLWPKGRSYDFMMVTLCHEIGHAILDIWCMPKFSKNERLVDAIGQGFWQTLKTAKYPRK